MLSAPDIAIIGAIALLVFGPEQLPRIARKVGGAMREVQLTSQQFIREMERAADEHEAKDTAQPASPVAVEEASLAPEVPVEGEPMLPGFEPDGVPSDNGAVTRAPRPASEPSEY